MGIKKVMAHLDSLHEAALREFGTGEGKIAQRDIITMVTVFEAWKAWGVAQIVESVDYASEVAKTHAHGDARKYYFSAPISLTGLVEGFSIWLPRAVVQGVLGEPLHGVLRELYAEDDHDNQVG